MSKLLLNLCSAEKYGDDMVFWSMNFNRLMKYNIRTKEMMEIKDKKLDDLKATPLLFNSSTMVDKKVFLAPFNSSYICVYDFEKKEIEMIPLNQPGRCSDIFLIEESLFLWGWGENNVRKVDVNSYSICDIECMGEIKITSNPVYINNSLLFTIDEKDAICEYIIEENKCIIHRIGHNNQLFNTISYIEGNVWLSGDTNIITKWNMKSNDTQEFIMNNIEYSHLQGNIKFMFGGSKVFGDFVYFSPYKSCNMVRINYLNGNIEILKTFNEATGGFFVGLDEKTVCLIVETGQHQASRNILVDLEGSLHEEKIFFVPSDSEIAIEYIRSELLHENIQMNLSDFIDML